MKKIYIASLLCIVGFAVPALAGPEGRVTADPTYFDGGNDATILSVARSTITPVLISGTAVNSGITPTVRVWRHREIVNTSNGLLMILPNNTSYTTFCGTCGIVLGTTTIPGLGDSYVVPHQGEIWGIWSDNTTSGGAGGSESYWNERKR